MIAIPPVIFKVVGIVLIIGFVYGLGWYQAIQSSNEEYEAKLSRQIAKSAEAQYEAERNLARVEAEHAAFIEGFNETALLSQKEVIRYVTSPAKKCVVSPEFERAHDALTSLHDVPSSDRMPPSPETTGKPDAVSAGELHDVAGDPRPALDDSVTLEAYGMCLDSYSELLGTYTLLRDWVKSSYDAQLASLGYLEAGKGLLESSR